jgi:D-arabinose 1-dehydrogenase-like Zn-dependent alcohol dehydrogenase
MHRAQLWTVFAPTPAPLGGGLGINGTMMVIGAVGALTVNSLDLLGKRASVRGWYSGTAVDSEDTLLFSQLNDIASMNEIFSARRSPGRL